MPAILPVPAQRFQDGGYGMLLTTLADGRTLHHQALGTQGSPVVLLHGYLDSHLSFFRLTDSLAQHHRVFAPDQRGHGESSPAADYSIAGFTADAVAFIEQLGLGPVHLGGHSLGGIVAQRVAAARPDLVRSLALISTARSAANNPALAEITPLLETLPDPVPDALIREFQGSTTFTRLPEDVFEIYLDETRKVTAAVWRGALAGLLADQAPQDPPSRIPTLILWGAEDSLFSAADQQALRAHYPSAQYRALPATGHAPNWERPAETTAALLAFWRTADAQGDQQ